MGTSFIHLLKVVEFKSVDVIVSILSLSEPNFKNCIGSNCKGVEKHGLFKNVGSSNQIACEVA